MSGMPDCARGKRFMSGKYAGHGMDYVAEHFPGYIVWCWKNVAGKMNIPQELYEYALESIRESKEREAADKLAAQDFAPCPPPPGPRRGVFVGDSGSNRLTPFQAATMKAVRESGARIEEDRFGNKRVIYPNGLRAPILDPLDSFVQMEERARQFFEGEWVVKPEDEPSIFQEMLEEAEGTSSFLDGIL